MCKAFFYSCKVKLLPGVDIDQIEKVEKRQFPGDVYAPDTPGLI